MVDLYLFFSSIFKNRKKYPWHEELLPICDWGCAIYTCVRAPSKEGIICTLHDGGISVLDYDLRAWFVAWVEGVSLWEEMFEKRVTTVPKPVTKEEVEITVKGKAKGKKWRKSP